MSQPSAIEPPPTMRLLDTLLVFFAAMAVALRPLLPGHGGAANLWVEMCIFVAAMAWLVRMAMQRRLRLVRTGMGVPALVLLAIAGVSTLRSPYRAASVAMLLEWASYAALFFVLVNAAAEGVDRRFFLRLLWASAFAVCLYGLFQQFVNLPLLLEQIEGDPERVMMELGLTAEDFGNLKERARGRIFATFLLANSFAGFLALVVPGFVGYVLDRLRAGDRQKGFLVASGLWVAAALTCLLLTYSKGGWVAFAFGSGLFCVLLGKGLLRRHARVAIGVAVAAAVLVGALFAAGAVRVQVFRDAAGSFDVRVGYWRGAAAMAKDNLLGGVGLGTFGAHYPRYRWPQARVSQQAHNDYLQVLAELGIFGLAAFVWLWATCLRRALGGRQESVGGESSPRRVGYVAGILAFALSSAVMATFTVSGWDTKAWWNVALVLGLGAAWLLFFAALGRGERAEPGELCRKGLACGLAAFLLHCAVDFDYNEPGVVLTAWVVAALAVASRREPIQRLLRPVPAFALGAAAFLAMIALQVNLTGAVRAEGEHELGRSKLIESHEAYKEGNVQKGARLIEESRQHFRRALRAGPLDATLRLEYGAMLARLLPPAYDTALFEKAVGMFARAAALNRASAAPHIRLAELFESAADDGVRAPLLPFVTRYEATRPQSGRNPIYLPAVAEFEAAAERDPNKPSLRLKLAVALEKHGDHAEAEANAARALALHDLVVAKHTEHVLRLTPEQLSDARGLLARIRARRQKP